MSDGAQQWLIPALVGGSTLLAGAGIRARLPAEWLRVDRSARMHSLGGTAHRLFERLGGRSWAPLVRSETLQRRLRLAGHGANADAATGVEVALALSAGLGTLASGLFAPPVVLLAPVAVLATARGFELAVGRRARERQRRMAANVPELVELLVATTDAGLSPAVALRRTAPVLRDPLGAELRRAVAEVELGAPWQRAIDEMVDGTEVSSLRALASALARSQQLGSALGMTLRRLADDLRAERRTLAEEAARKAPIKMLFPLVFLILPAFLLLTVGPVVLATIKSLH
jgi:tight adherence protein C